ncbi:hypothetical protein [Streptomyces olivaceoviridis]|uniref:hypothetical protein n=1 Tax=Streptomyces olivaceoviridis TaxID=1921 RepID=UPI0037012F1A
MDEFEADAVVLNESTPGATYKSIAADLGINRATLRERILRDREHRGLTPAPAPTGQTSVQSGQTPPSADPHKRILQLDRGLDRRAGGE